MKGKIMDNGDFIWIRVLKLSKNRNIKIGQRNTSIKICG